MKSNNLYQIHKKKKKKDTKSKELETKKQEEINLFDRFKKKKIK